jgi:hypothetical protein
VVAPTRTVKAVVLVLALLFGVALLQGVSAEKKPTSTSMSTRVKWQEDDCLNEGGSSFWSTTTYNGDGSVKSVTTKCRGGDNDGRTCVNTATTIDCSPAIRPTRTTVSPNLGGGVILK